ncbi:putative esterase [Hyella patelloides LEGE 07179]|uniref:Putative esterase n=1 Tax=Hyella patelloides LEGE 07179 TaxID=945734 RepID=A0A563VK80_9CYAN|nr:alpha/beta hydrolase [Hyella patelloides]VEP11831.1 putative esterase [Hyella patelloides LEGE 07179]
MTANKTLEAISLFPQGNLTSLLVMLHGWGANYQDLASLSQMLDLPEFGYLFPNAPFEHPQVPGGRAWYALESPNYTGIDESRQLLFDWLNALEDNTNIPLERTYVTGFSQGGAMTLDVALMLPVAGICSISGYLHYEPKPLEDDAPPVLIVHGKQDEVVPIDEAKNARDKLTAIGVEVQYQEFDMGHEITPPVLDLLQKFISN